MLYLDALRTYDFVIGSADWRSAKAKMQRRDRKGRFAEMGGGFTFDFTFPDLRQKTVTGKIVGISGTEDVDVEIKGDPDIPDGVYSVPSKSGEMSKAVLDLDDLDLPAEKVVREKKAEPAPAQVSTQLTPTDDIEEAKATGRPLRILQRGSYPQPVQEQYDKIKKAYTDTPSPENAEALFVEFKSKSQEAYESAGFDSEKATLITNAIHEELIDFAQHKQYLSAVKPEVAEKYGEEARLQIAKNGLKDASIAIAVQVGVLEKIIADGRFKSQFESKTSQGALNPLARTKGDISQLGYHPDTDPSKRPIYGYATSNGRIDNESMGKIKQYGQLQMVLKKDVESRATYTADDSLTWAGLQPAPFGVPSAEAARTEYPSYTEAQIHGGVSLADVDYVAVQVGVPDETDWRDNKITEEQFAKVSEMLSAAGIRVVPLRDGKSLDTLTGTLMDPPVAPADEAPKYDDTDSVV
ncbi:cytoplasmic protein [Actinomycetia phage DSL-LC01]|nr:cytoplasmic protein [Actinomycetia phage DSL-LC01]